ncbi:alpha/beta fold hydrolase [Larkinella punicea]|uniref:Alpha/beta hydrolase n=1 Tax=Larkinella punicea TaxID=2315727 RepID=A0A368JH02_9BACT|nr:alpha/beta hydrolase [Larkinella punicea]RCR65974.1 alpha/beta hydrolase [Larkinella punicea]
MHRRTRPSIIGIVTYVLVGHSMGGLYARAFAGFNPNDIAGLVFIDPADFTETKEDWNTIFRRIGVPEKRIDEMLYARLYQPAKVDSVRFGPWSEGQVLAALRRTDFAEVTRLPVPNVPIYFFIGGRFEVAPERRSTDYDHTKFFEVRTNVNIERWRKFIYSSSKGGALIYLSNSGHYLHRDDARAVIGTLKMLLENLGG